MSSARASDDVIIGVECATRMDAEGLTTLKDVVAVRAGVRHINKRLRFGLFARSTIHLLFGIDEGAECAFPLAFQ